MLDSFRVLGCNNWRLLLYNQIAVGSRSGLRVLVRGLVVAIPIDSRYLLG